MDLAAYVDGIVALLTKAGATQRELAGANVEQSLAHCHMKGVSFEAAAASMCKKLGIELA